MNWQSKVAELGVEKRQYNLTIKRGEGVRDRGDVRRGVEALMKVETDFTLSDVVDHSIVPPRAGDTLPHLDTVSLQYRGTTLGESWNLEL